MKEKLISIICTVKNGEGTISQMMDSVLAQTYQNWELIIIDDGSNDSTNDIVSRYIKNDARINLVNTTGIGRGNALNKAITKSNGDYIVNLDADDLIHPRKLSIQMEAFLSVNNLFLLSTKGFVFYDNDLVTWSNEINAEQDLIIIDKKILIRNTINHSSVMMDGKKLKKLGGYDQDRKTQIDYELWLRAFKSKMKMRTINTELTAKRLHKGQSFENKRRLNYLTNATILQLKYIHLLRKYQYILFPFFNFLKGLTPLKLRMKLREVLKK